MPNSAMDATNLTELEILRKQVAELEAKLATYQQLEPTLQRYTDIIQQMHIGLYIYHLEDLNDNRSLRMVAVNPAAEAMTGVTEELVVGRTLDENFPGLRERDVPQAYAEVVRTGKPIVLEDLYYGDARVLDAAFEVRAFPLPNQHVGVTFELITERKRDAQTMRENEQRLMQFIDALPIGVFVIEPNGQPFYVNQMAMDILGKGVSPNVGTDQLAEVYSAYLVGTSETYPAARMPLVRSLAGERSMIDDMEIQHPDQRIRLEIHGAPIRNSDGMVIYGLAAFTDITLRKQAEAALREHAAQQEMIAAQQITLQELSTPLMPIAEGVVVMPIIGAIDSARAQQMMETLLEGIAVHDAAIAILDITGVKMIDTQVAGALIRAAQSARLLGAQVLLSGISPEIAQTLVHIGIDLRDIITKRSLQQSIAYALAQRR